MQLQIKGQVCFCNCTPPSKHRHGRPLLTVRLLKNRLYSLLFAMEKLFALCVHKLNLIQLENQIETSSHSHHQFDVCCMELAHYTYKNTFITSMRRCFITQYIRSLYNDTRLFFVCANKNSGYGKQGLKNSEYLLGGKNRVYF